MQPHILLYVNILDFAIIADNVSIPTMLCLFCCARLLHEGLPPRSGAAVNLAFRHSCPSSAATRGCTPIVISLPASEVCNEIGCLTVRAVFGIASATDTGTCL